MPDKKRTQTRDQISRIPLHALVNWRRKGGHRGTGCRSARGWKGFDPGTIHRDDLRGYKRVKLNKPSRRDRRHPRRTP